LWFVTTLGEIVCGLPECGDVSSPPLIFGAPCRGFFRAHHSIRSCLQDLQDFQD